MKNLKEFREYREKNLVGLDLNNLNDIKLIKDIDAFMILLKWVAHRRNSMSYACYCVSTQEIEKWEKCLNFGLDNLFKCYQKYCEDNDGKTKIEKLERT